MGEKRKMRSRKKITLQCGSEEGMKWDLQLGIQENTKIYTGSFVTYGEEKKRRDQIRFKDNAFFQKRLGSIMDKYEIDHDWENEARVTLKSPLEHRNCIFGKANQKDWVEKEEWLEEKYKGERR